MRPMRRGLRPGALTRGLFLVALFAGAALLAAWLEPPDMEVSGRASASDGDSLRIGDTRIRLAGIDAPELAQDCARADGTRWACGEEARREMSRLLSGGPLDCTSWEHDRFGRLVARCLVGERDIAAAIVRAGLAVATEGYGREQAEARSVGRGLWQGEFQMPRAWRDAHPDLGPNR